jgi:ethanolaminephosphotransferase
VQTWDEYHTKTLTLGLVSGPVEGILTLCIVYAITAVKGGGWYWQQPMLPTLGFPEISWLPKAAYTADFGDFYMLYGGLVLIFNTVSSAQNVIRARRARGEHAREALLGLLPFFASWTLILAYLLLNPHILQHHLVPFVFYVGLVNAYSVGQIITAHLVVMPFPYQNVIALPLIYGVVDSVGPVLQEYVGFGWPTALGEDMYQVAFMFTCLGLAVGVYGSFVVDVSYPDPIGVECSAWVLRRCAD